MTDSDIIREKIGIGEVLAQLAEEATELAVLHDLESDGYLYMARDKDGKLFAFRRKPEHDGAYWSEPGPGYTGTLRILEDFAFIDSDAEAPAEICRLLGYPF